MPEKVFMLPGPAHPITTEANPARAGGRVVADSTLSLTLWEASYPAARYIPRADVDMAVLTRSTHASFRRYKGEATYLNLEGRVGRIAAVAYSYENPFPRLGSNQGSRRHLPDPLPDGGQQGMLNRVSNLWRR